MKASGSALSVGQRVDFRRAPAARAADGLIFSSLSTRRRAVGFHGRRVEENLVRRTVGLRERLKETDPYALARRSSRSFALAVRFGLCRSAVFGSGALPHH
jgi:hypothetical protein